MNIRPLHDRVLIKRLQAEGQSPGGIHIPATARDKSMEATVVAVGSGKVLDDGSVLPLAVEVGDKVLLGNKYAVENCPQLGPDHLIVSERDILGILDGD